MAKRQRAPSGPPSGDDLANAKRAKTAEAAAAKSKAPPGDVRPRGGPVKEGAAAPIATDRKDRCVLLRNLHKDRTKEDILQHYARVGSAAVRSVKWKKSPHVAVVAFAGPNEAARALRMPGPTIRGTTATVERFEPPSAVPDLEAPAKSASKAAVRGPKEVDEHTYRMFVGKCPDTITDDHLYSHYSGLGEGAVMKVTWIKPGGVFKGYGFVSFRDGKALRAALAMPPPEVDGRRLTVQAAGHKASPFQLFVGGYKGTGKVIGDVQKYFEKLLGKGCITRSRDLTEKDGSPRGAGFLDFVSEAMLDQAFACPPPVFGDYTLKVEKPGVAAPPQPKGRSQPRELRVLHCPATLREEDLREHYAPLGAQAVERVTWTRNRRTAFVVFVTSKLMRKALKLGPPVVDFHVLQVESCEAQAN